MEHLDIIDNTDTAIGVASLSDIYDKKLPHRIVHILIFDSKGRMALQKRSKDKSYCPLHWSTAVGGHVQTKESYEEAAQRECYEELGINVPIALLAKEWYDDGNLKKMLATFKALYEGSFEVNPHEVDEVAYFSIDEIKELIAKNELFHPELLFLLKQHFGVNQ